VTAKPPPASRPESPQTIQALVKRWRASVVRGTLPASGVTPAALQQFVDDLESALSAASVPASGWQPIETAPKPESGRRKVIDVWCVTDDHEAAEFYFGNTMSGVKDRMLWQGRVSEVYWRDGAWRPVSGLRRHALTVTPTHWMPLPAPPEDP